MKTLGEILTEEEKTEAKECLVEWCLAVEDAKKNGLSTACGNLNITEENFYPLLFTGARIKCLEEKVEERTGIAINFHHLLKEAIKVYDQNRDGKAHTHGRA